MIKKRLLILTLLLALLATPIATLAANINNAKFFAVIQISNNGTALTNAVATANISTTNLINGDYLNSSANNCVVRTSSGVDVQFMPGYTPDGNPWCIWVPSIGANGIQSDILYTANSTGGLINYFPGAGGMTTSDNETLELSDNFTIEQCGWVDTTAGAGKNLVHKEEAFKTYVSPTVSDNITSDVLVTGGEALQDSYEGSDDSGASVRGSGFWAAQTFTTDTCYSLTRVELDLTKINAPAGNLDIVIRATSGGSPVGSDLATGSIVANTVIDDWNTVNITDLILETGIKYALVASVPDGEGDNLVTWREDDTTPDYSGGSKFTSADGGSSWTPYVASDFLFRVYGDEITAAASVTATGVSTGNHTVRTTQGWALDFDGTNDEVNCGNHISLSPPNLISVELWARDDIAGSQTLVMKKADFGATLGYTVYGGTGTFSYVAYQAGAYTSMTSSASYPNGSWHHIVGVDNDGGTAKLYIDGILDGTDATPGSGIPVSPHSLYLGESPLGALDLDGQIAQVRIYDRALSPAEVLEHYSGIYNDETGLIARWDVDEGAGGTIYDTSTNSNDGTITAATWATGILKIFVDDTLEDVDSGASVPDNDTNWTFVENYSMLWLGYQEIEIDGVLSQDIDWEYANVFQDATAYDNDATPSFRTQSSDADVTAEMISFMPMSEAKAPDYVLGEAIPFIDSAGLTGNLTGGTFTIVPPVGEGTFPLAAVITELANATDTPPQLPLLIIAIFVILAASLSVSAIIRRYGSGSIMVKTITITAFMGIFIALGNFAIDFWMLVVFLTLAITLMFASKQVGWS